jgi:nucleoside-diphosphate-sugar epimerase
VLGPVVHDLQGLSALNPSSGRFGELASGAAKDSCPPTGSFLWVDVRDVALSHVLAAEKPEAAGQRFFITAGKFSNKEIAEQLWDAFPELRDKLPTGEALKPGDYPPAGSFGCDNTKSKEVLGLTYRSLKESAIDTVKSLKPFLKS